ncbi:IS110 family RNA-guided transposase [Lacticaseibacillus nasuensis]|uniref:IS110 family transposase n=1 Tax=Lacticaseibacillus nasuensis TaxID=944671 RepID=UPI002246E1B8|nr:IS110 family transposase [Lacticaseibacillus nasuensis]MCX2456569.1 IS110 family transposase [Lacticaseibacillus nasuensis]
MEVVAESVAGIDVHQKQITVTVLIGEAEVKKPKKVSQRFETITTRLRDCGNWLKDLGVQQVLMESTGQYWRPVWQILEPLGFKMILCNPRIIKNIPGKKTDQKDSEWLSELARYGLVTASYVPPRQIQELRESTRMRKSLTETMTVSKNEIHNILQRSNIKLTTYVSDLFSGTGRAIMAKLENGEVITLQYIKKLIGKKHMKATPEQILASLDGILTRNDRQLLAISMSVLRGLEAQLKVLEAQIDEQVEAFSDLYHRLQDLPGCGKLTAQVIIAEIGVDVSPFPDAHHLASWAGVCPGNYESAGIKHGSRILHGDVYLKTALLTCAMGARLKKESGLKDYYHRLVSHMGAQKALVALAHKILRIIYVMIKDGITYTDYKKSQRIEITLAAKHIG